VAAQPVDGSDLAALLRRPRYEVIPAGGIDRRVAAQVPREVTLTVTATPRKGMDATLDLAERLTGEGFHVVPHLAARLVRDEAHLREILARIARMRQRDVFVVAGDAARPAGIFPDALSLLEAMAPMAGDLLDIGIAGYPERHPFIEDDLTIQAMWDKRRYATYIVSNLCFDPRVVQRWVTRVRRRGVDLPIYVGMAGAVDAARLLRISSRIGIGDSVRFLRGHVDWFLHVIRPGGYSPGRFAAGLLPALGTPERRVAGLHVFTFNEIERTERWRQKVLERLASESRGG
jgi:methylenetetrahydrofolate reductase (NADPH)